MTEGAPMRILTSMIGVFLCIIMAMTPMALPQGSKAPQASGTPLAAPLPRPLLKTHLNAGSGKYVFSSRTWDLAQIRKAFNGAIVDFGQPSLIEDLHAAGLAAIVEFDKKGDFVKGKSVQTTVRAIINQVRAHPGTIGAIRVADRLNQKLTPSQAIAYLEQTGGAFHREIPGVPILVDVVDWELTCGLPRQSSCLTHRIGEYSDCTDEVLHEIYRSGYVDGFELAVNLKGDDADAMAKAM